MVPSEMPTRPPGGETAWAGGDSGEKLWLKKSACESPMGGEEVLKAVALFRCGLLWRQRAGGSHLISSQREADFGRVECPVSGVKVTWFWIWPTPTCSLRDHRQQMFPS